MAESETYPEPKAVKIKSGGFSGLYGYATGVACDGTIRVEFLHTEGWLMIPATDLEIVR